ncbi:Pheophorbide a oxygenase protein, partial [Thalictrum thalictroides]
LPEEFDNPTFSTVTIQRDLFYGYDTLMENVSDPSHIDFAHLKENPWAKKASHRPN